MFAQLNQTQMFLLKSTFRDLTILFISKFMMKTPDKKVIESL